MDSLCFDAIVKFLRSKTVGKIRELLIFVFFCHLIQNFFILQEHDRLLKYLKPKSIATYANQTECSLSSDIYYESDVDLDRFKRWKQLNEELAEEKVAYLSLPGLATMSVSIYCSIWFVFHYSPHIYLRRKKIICETLSFALNPLQQRAKVRSELNALIDKLISILEIGFADRDDLIDEGYSDGRVEMEDLQMIQILEQIKRFNLLEFQHLSLAWHRKLINSMLSSLVFNLSIPIVAVGNFWFLMSLDLMAKAEHRLKILRCKNFLGPEGTLIQNFINLQPLTDDQDLKVYIDNLNSDSSWINLKLALNVEAKYFLSSTKSWIFVVEAISSLLAGTLFGAADATLFFSDFTANLIWLDQLNQQVNTCQFSIEKQINSINANPATLNRQLAITYLNFELFRRHRSRCKKMATFSILQNGLNAILQLLSFYLISMFMSSSNEAMIIAVTSAVVMTFNAHLVCSAYESKKVKLLMRDMETIIANCTTLEKSCNLKFVLDLWRRQLVDQQESQILFDLTFFGIYINYEKLVPINCYYALITYLMLIND